MSLNIEQCVFVGHIGRISQLRHTQTGVPVFDFSLALDRSGWDAERNTRIERPPVWLKVSVWDRQATSLEAKLAVGMRVMVTGQLQAPDSWIDNATGKATGQNHLRLQQINFNGVGAAKVEPAANDDPGLGESDELPPF